MNITLYWITHDMRLDDNPALLRAAQSDVLICAWCVDRRQFSPFRYHTTSMGEHRWRFQMEAVSEMSAELSNLGQHLYLCFGYPEQELAQLIQRHKVTRLVCSRQFGADERRTLRTLQGYFPGLRIEETDADTLYNQDELRTDDAGLLKGFTYFRRQQSDVTISQPIQAPSHLPRTPLRIVTRNELPDWLSQRYRQPLDSRSDPLETHHSDGAPEQFIGGEAAARRQLRAYFDSQHPSTYKHTRDQLQGWHNSSKFSAWLANGNLSARRIHQQLQQYEARHGANESTSWLLFELQWREYFRWLARWQGARLFSLRGLREKPPLACLHPERYQKWCHGNTPWPIVNACMRQLATTGYLSNRGRQIAASCFVNELGLDWRYGAAWFEHQLVDYDVALNWGNWQYIAGVGVDPRGGRHFNLDKQTAIYDPDGDFIQKWAPDSHHTVLDSVDAADWPVS